MVGTPTDDKGHGTMVAGVIGAIGDNDEGVVGTCWNVSLVSLKAFDANGRGYSSHSALAINFAEAQDIPIINFSAGWRDDDNNNNDVTDSQERYDYALRTVIDNYSGLFVCAAGNHYQNNDEADFLPGNYRLDNIITVGSSEEWDEKSEFSNYGRLNVDIFAPGGNINTTTSDGGYGADSGTSFAAPYVAGVAALILSQYPNADAAELKRTILQNVDYVYSSSGYNMYGEFCTSGGRLNAYKALSNIIHSFLYINQGTYLGHSCTCGGCGYTYTENHTWVGVASSYRCSKCRATSSFGPVTPGN